ncbi:MAG: peptide deformylase, partial [Clostridia bacterium]|nr:peptide deformylase [Clostridia bacterium]
MAVLNILKEGDETLRKKSRAVEEITPRILQLLDDMHETLEIAQGVGLAAPQVGVLRRIVIVEIGDKKYEMINPEIIETKGKQEEIEACLSVPEKYGLV